LDSVLTVGAVDCEGRYLCYSSQGPGRIAHNKPDVTCYAHFSGSGQLSADTGTSTSCPLVAGVIAAIRTKHSPKSLPPRQLRQLIRATAGDAPNPVWRRDVGYGTLNPTRLLAALDAL